MYRLLTPLFVFALSGCVLGEITASHVEPGGLITATLNGGAPVASTGLGDASKEPFSLDGFSAVLTFGLVAANDASGASVVTGTATANASLSIPITVGGKNQLEVSLDGASCVASEGTVTLTTNSSLQLTGTFSASGTLSGGTTPCTVTGSFSKVPVQRTADSSTL
jgi:hypothetical protein